VVLGLMALILGGCAAAAERPDAHVTLSSDEFSKTIDIVGPVGGENPFFDVKKFYNLVTRVDKKTHRYFHELETRIIYFNDFYNFQFAADDTAQDLELVRIARSNRFCSDCYKEEDFNIVIPDAALRAHVTTGYSIKVWSRAGYYVILEISPAMIAMQLAGLDEFQKTGTISQR
jgi:hypothetical protein